MKLIEVPYIPQYNTNACGAAVLEMVYKYYGLADISQEEIFNKYREVEPHGSGNFRITTDNLVQDAKSRGFEASWGRVNYLHKSEGIKEISQFIRENRAPVIVCQKFSRIEPKVGHFRIVLGVDKSNVYFHDPSKEIGGPNMKWSINKFMEFWQKTGDNVTGGIFILISKIN